MAGATARPEAVSYTHLSEFDTLDEYKKEIKDNLTKKKEEQAKTEKENAVVDKAVENATMEIPEAMIDTDVYKRQP